MLGLHSFSFSKIQRHLPPFLIVAQLLSVHASMNCLNNSHAKRFAQSADYFWLCLRLSVGSFQCDVSPKHTLVTTGNVGDHYHISPVTIQSNLNVLIKRHFGNFTWKTWTELFDELQNLGSKWTNQIEGKFPERSASVRNVVDSSNFVTNLLFTF